MSRFLVSLALVAATHVVNATERIISHVYDPTSFFIIEEVAPGDPTRILYRLAHRACPGGWDMVDQWSRARTDGKHVMHWRIVCFDGDPLPAPPAPGPSSVLDY